jgi:hypothetical protein
MIKNVNILGANYKIQTNASEAKDKDLAGRFGYCSYVDHRIVIADLNTIEGWADENEDVKASQIKETLRHEIIHAFLFESGLGGSSVGVGQWALNEEMVDWFAMQFPKMVEVFRIAGCL